MFDTYKIKKYSILFLPTWSGVVMYVFLAVLAIVLNQFGMINNYLKLPHDLHVAQNIARLADRFLTAVIGVTKTETLVVGLFWAMVGFIVYIFLRGLSQFIMDLDQNLSARKFVWPKGTNRYRPLQLLAEQAVFQIFAFLGLIVFIFGPLAAVLRGPVFTGLVGSVAAVQYFVWFIASMVVWHIVVILLRLLFLRPRLFG